MPEASFESIVYTDPTTGRQTATAHEILRRPQAVKDIKRLRVVLNDPDIRAKLFVRHTTSGKEEGKK